MPTKTDSEMRMKLQTRMHAAAAANAMRRRWGSLRTTKIESAANARIAASAEQDGLIVARNGRAWVGITRIWLSNDWLAAREPTAENRPDTTRASRMRHGSSGSQTEA